MLKILIAIAKLMAHFCSSKRGSVNVTDPLLFFIYNIKYPIKIQNGQKFILKLIENCGLSGLPIFYFANFTGPIMQRRSLK